MKKITLYLYLFFLTASTLSAQSITGVWKGKSEGETGVFTFDKDGYMTMERGSSLLGGKRFKMDGKEFSMKYLIEEQAGKARNLDFVMYDLSTNKEVMRMLCLVEWITDNQIKLCMSMEEASVRPKDFGKKEDVIILTRK